MPHYIIFIFNFLFGQAIFSVSQDIKGMTKFGEYLARKMLNRSELARKTGITRNRMQNLAELETTKITGQEVHLLALALDIEPNELHEILFGDIKLPGSK